MKDKSNKILSITLALLIVVAAIIILYNNFLRNENQIENPDENFQKNNIVLQTLYNDTYINYTLDQLEKLESITGYGGYITSNNQTSGPYELTGVKILILLKQFNITSEVYSINVKASDGYSKVFNLSYINGEIPFFNENGEEIGIGDVTMIINYKENGEYLDDLIGPIRLAFICEDGFTSSKLWIKQVESIIIIDDF